MQPSFGHLHQKQWSPLPGKQPPTNRLHKSREYALTGWNGVHKKRQKRDTLLCNTPAIAIKLKLKHPLYPSLYILFRDWGQLPYGSINCLIYSHYNTEVTLARDLLPGYVSENTIDIQQHVYIGHIAPRWRAYTREGCSKQIGFSIWAPKPTHRHVHFPRWHSQGCKQEHNKNLAKSKWHISEASLCPQAPASQKVSFISMQISFFYISRYPRGQL